MIKNKKHPSWLDKYGQEYWRRITPALQKIGKLDDLSIDIVCAGCQAYSTYRQMLDKMEAEGRIITTSSGTVKAHPAIAIERSAFDMLLKVWKALELQGKPPVLPDDDLDAFIEGTS